ncbi:unnamed protein product, partial [Scytosiphon promiscuus]
MFGPVSHNPACRLLHDCVISLLAAAAASRRASRVLRIPILVHVLRLRFSILPTLPLVPSDVRWRETHIPPTYCQFACQLRRCGPRGYRLHPNCLNHVPTCSAASPL